VDLAGVSAAYFLRKMGYVTLYERKPTSEECATESLYRLPREILKKGDPMDHRPWSHCEKRMALGKDVLLGTVWDENDAELWLWMLEDSQ
jgi:hypothetical protein